MALPADVRQAAVAQVERYCETRVHATSRRCSPRIDEDVTGIFWAERWLRGRRGRGSIPKRPREYSETVR